MCSNPYETVINETIVTLHCGKCDNCVSLRKMDWVGRCVAEMKSGRTPLVVCLTYGDGDYNPASKTLDYSDVQKFFKRLRKANFNVRYIVAGEYGSKKGRAHWHAVLFFKDGTPQVPINQNINWRFWPHGYSYFQRPDARGFAYPLKYIQKDTNRDDSHFSMSKKPPIGDEYFDQLADRYVVRGMSPVNFKYSWDDITFPCGKKAIYYMRGLTKERFVIRFWRKWWAAHDRSPPPSKEFDEFTNYLVGKYPDWLGYQSSIAILSQMKLWGLLPELLPDLHKEFSHNAFFEQIQEKYQKSRIAGRSPWQDWLDLQAARDFKREAVRRVKLKWQAQNPGKNYREEFNRQVNQLTDCPF